MPPQNQFILSLWEPLVECDPVTGEPQPAAAESWAWSENRRILTIKLRPTARWSNGDPVTAEDFVRSWRCLLRRNLSLAHTLFPLKHAEEFHRSDRPESVPLGLVALDALTLRLELEGASPAFVARLADPLLAPLHATSAEVLASNSYLTQPEGLVTNGPFRLKAYLTPGPRLLASEHYHDRAAVRLEGIQFVQAESLDVAPLLLAAGRADLLSPIAPDESRTSPALLSLTRHSEPTLSISLWEFNQSRSLLRDARVRRALALALDRAAAIPAKEANHLVPAWAWMPDLPGWKGQALIHENTVLARQLLAEAGYPNGAGLPVLQLLLPESMKGNSHPEAWCERWFHELGVRTRLIYESREHFSVRLTAGDFDLVYQTLVATVPDAGDLLDYFTWPQDKGGTKWVDEEVRSLLAQAEAKQGQDRVSILQKAEQRVIAEMGVIPLMFYRRESLLTPEVRGWYPDPLARQSLKRLWLEPAIRRSNASGDFAL